MSLFNAITSQLTGSLGSTEGQPPGMLNAVSDLLNNQPGGLPGLIGEFQKNGLGGVIASWVGTGQNLPISADQLQSVLGNEQVQAVAQKLGFTPDQAATQLAALLPQVVDKLTPDGTVPDAGVLGGLLGLLKGKAD